MLKINSIMKKPSTYLKRISIVFVLIIFAITVCFVLQVHTPTNFDEMDSNDQEMFTRLYKINKVFDESSQFVWDAEYRPQKEPIALLPKSSKIGFTKCIYLINATPYIDTTKFKKVTFPKEMKLEDVYVAKWYNYQLFYHWFENFGFIDLDKKRILSYGVMPNLLVNDCHLAFPTLMVHESFHFYEQSKWHFEGFDKQNPVAKEIENYPYNKSHYGLLKKEYALLDLALLQLGNKELLGNTMREWVKIREARYAKWPQLEQETHTETTEGTAFYVEQKVAQLSAASGSKIRDAKRMNSYQGCTTFSKALDTMIKEDKVSYLIHNLSYDKGRSLSLILDILSPKWKSELRTRDMPTLYALVKQNL
jgi:hypothetical protein